MSKYELPDLPSDKELGLTAEEIKELEAEFGDTGPEMSPEEMAALLGEEPPAPAPTSDKPSAKQTAAAGTDVGQPSKRELRAAERARKKAKDEAAKASRARAKQEKEAAKDKAKQKKKAASGDDEAAESEEAAPEAIEEGPRSKWRGLATAAILLVACIFASSRTGQPRPVPANAGEAEFSSARAMGTLVLTFGIGPVGPLTLGLMIDSIGASAAIGIGAAVVLGGTAMSGAAAAKLRAA